jgi:RHS repeat-associated protein
MPVEEIETLHLFDGQQRLLMVDQILETDRPALGKRNLYRYALSNHLGSSTVEVDENADIISYEEYHPYGTTAFQSGRNAAEVKLKRYRYTGKERDEESGLYYHGARYYAPWIGRWSSCDPAGIVDSLNLYVYARNDPLLFVDPDGHRSDKATDPAVWYSLQHPGAAEKWEKEWLNRTVIEPYYAASEPMPEAELKRLLATESQRAKAAFRDFAQQEWDYENQLVLVNTGRGAQALTRAEHRQVIADQYNQTVLQGLVADPISSVITGLAVISSDDRRVHMQAAQVGQTVSGLTWVAGAGANLKLQNRGVKNIAPASNAAIRDLNRKRLSLPPQTFENLDPRDKPDPPTRLAELLYENGKWRTRAANGEVRTAKGLYNFVTVNGKIYVDTKAGHIDLSMGEPVDYAGQIRFGRNTSTRGQLVEWTNASGHIAPGAAYAHQARLPMDKFVPHNVTLHKLE